MLIPIRNMKFNDMLTFTRLLQHQDIKSVDKLTFSFSELKFIEPAGAVVFLSAMDILAEEGVVYDFEPIVDKHNSAVSYGKHMGIFQQLNLCEDHSYEYGDTYISPKKVAIKDIHKQNPQIENFYEQFSKDIVSHSITMLNYPVVDEVKDLFTFVVRELIRNIFDHSQTAHFYYASQKYPKSEFVEVAICDEGCGLRETVPFDTEEIWFGQDTDENAIRKAVLPGITAESNNGYAPEDYKNSGYGLALVRKIIEETDGEFSIATGSKAINFHKNGENVNNCYIRGTVVRMRINVQRLNTVNFKELVSQAKNEARKYGVFRKPSGASQTLKSKDLI